MDINLNDTTGKTLEKIFYNYIYYAHLGEGVGSEQSGDRPVLVVDCYVTSSVCVVIPITLERLSDNKPYHIDLSNGRGTVLVEQIRTISKSRIYKNLYVNKKYATISDEDRDKINAQLENICRLKPLFLKNS